MHKTGRTHESLICLSMFINPPSPCPCISALRLRIQRGQSHTGTTRRAPGSSASATERKTVALSSPNPSSSFAAGHSVESWAELFAGNKERKTRSHEKCQEKRTEAKPQKFSSNILIDRFTVLMPQNQSTDISVQHKVCRLAAFQVTKL